MGKERLDRIISSQTSVSRSQAVKLIRSGRASVDGRVMRSPDHHIDPLEHRIEFCGEIIEYKKYLYIMLNKPAGVVSASRDTKLPTVLDLLPVELRRAGLFPAGRLDRDTEGLLIITDDGDYGHRVTAPAKGVFKIYEAMLDNRLTDRQIELLEGGIELDGGEVCREARVRELDLESCLYEIRICEGKYHQIKRMAQAVGCKVLKLRRLAIGALSLDDGLKAGECRELTEEERELPFVNDNAQRE